MYRSHRTGTGPLDGGRTTKWPPDGGRRRHRRWPSPLLSRCCCCWSSCGRLFEMACSRNGLRQTPPMPSWIVTLRLMAVLVAAAFRVLATNHVTGWLWRPRQFERLTKVSRMPCERTCHGVSECECVQVGTICLRLCGVTVPSGHVCGCVLCVRVRVCVWVLKCVNHWHIDLKPSIRYIYIYSWSFLRSSHPSHWAHNRNPVRDNNNTHTRRQHAPSVYTARSIFQFLRRRTRQRLTKWAGEAPDR